MAIFDQAAIRATQASARGPRRAPRETTSAQRPGLASGLRVALFSGNYNCVRDGANNALNRLVDFLLRHGAAVRVYSPTALRAAFAASGDLVSVPSLPIPGRPEYRFALGLPRAIREDIRQFRPTIFHLSAPDLLGYRALAFGHALGVPVVASLHTRFETYLDYYGLGLLTGLALRYLKTFYRGCDRVMVPNPGLAEMLASWGLEGRLSLWLRGVDRDQFSPARRSEAWRRAHGYADNEIVLLFFGRIVWEKGLAEFTEAVARLRAAGIRTRPLVVGDGPAVEAFRASLGDACFTGHLQGTALGTAIASADILLNPSTTEAFGNVNLEAMAAGLAVVSAGVPSASALIDDGRTGLLVPPEQPGGYTAALHQLHRYPLLRRKLGRAATAAARHFDWDGSLAAVVAAYRLAETVDTAQCER